MLEAVDLQCIRGERTLFHGLRLCVRAGELWRVAGANGRGKTSLLRLLCGLMTPESGEVRWEGVDVRRLREAYWRRLLHIGHANAVKDDLTPAENLEASCALAGIGVSRQAIAHALDAMGLAGCERLPARELSQGQRRRIALSRLAFGAAQPLWILDEPFTALDPDAVGWVRDALARHAGRGGLLVYTTHQEAGLEATGCVDLDRATA